MSLKLDKENKVILLDWGYYTHASIYATYPANQPKRSIPSIYTSLRMILGDLRQIGVQPDDLVIVAVDRTHDVGNWRAILDSNYKASRKSKREKRTDIDWTKEYSSHERLLNNIEKSTPFYTIGIDTLECDDIAAYSVRHFKDNQCIIIATDGDFEQLYCFDNVKIFNPKTKRYKIVKNPYKVLQKKIDKEIADDLRSEVTNEKEFEIRKQIVDLTELPDFVEEKISGVLKGLREKSYDINNLMFDSVAKQFMNIYNNDNPAKYEDAVKFELKKKDKVKIKKEKKKQLELIRN